jgi:hypothetical protein
MCESNNSKPHSSVDFRTRDNGVKARGREDLARAWEAVGGNRDLSGSISISKLKSILESFELGTELVVAPCLPSLSLVHPLSSAASKGATDPTLPSTSNPYPRNRTSAPQ